MSVSLLKIFENPAVKDAETIQTMIDYRILHAAWHEYSRIQSMPPNISTANSRRATTPVWTALTLLRNFHGNFDKFAKEDLYYLKALSGCIGIYEEVSTALSNYTYSDEEAVKLFDSHPDLCDAIPPTFEEHRHHSVNAILIQVIAQYRGLLKEFMTRYGEKIDVSIKKYATQDGEALGDEEN